MRSSPVARSASPWHERMAIRHCLCQACPVPDVSRHSKKCGRNDPNVVSCPAYGLSGPRGLARKVAGNASMTWSIVIHYPRITPELPPYYPQEIDSKPPVRNCHCSDRRVGDSRNVTWFLRGPGPTSRTSAFRVARVAGCRNLRNL